MNLRTCGRVAFAMIVILPLQLNSLVLPTESLLQEPLKSYKVVSHETHERVLDIVFPRDEASWNYDLVLRFEPSFAPESQIIVKSATFVQGRVVGFEVVEYTSMSGNIYVKLNEIMAQGGKEDPAEMAKTIQVRRRVIQVPVAQIRQWRASFADSISDSMKTLEQRSRESEQGTETITLDGTFYELWYDQVASDVSFRLLDHEVSNRKVTGLLRIVRWMNSVRLDVEKLK